MRYTVFDIETRIDKALVRAVFFPQDEELSDEDAYQQKRQQLLERQGNDFFPLTFHVPVSIAIGQVDEARVLTAVETLTLDVADEASSKAGPPDVAPPDAEAAMVRTFWERLERFPGTLVSFNGRGFDLPVLELQALKHGCSIPRYFRGRARYRYSDEGHYDLYDFLTNYGVHRLQGGFNALAKLIGLPGKTGMDGSMVQQYWEAGRLDDIHRYCRTDVVQTYFLFLRVELLRGHVSQEQYETAVAASEPFLQDDDTPSTEDPPAP